MENYKFSSILENVNILSWCALLHYKNMALPNARTKKLPKVQLLALLSHVVNLLELPSSPTPSGCCHYFSIIYIWSSISRSIFKEIIGSSEHCPQE